MVRMAGVAVAAVMVCASACPGFANSIAVQISGYTANGDFVQAKASGTLDPINQTFIKDGTISITETSSDGDVIIDTGLLAIVNDVSLSTDDYQAILFENQTGFGVVALRNQQRDGFFVQSSALLGLAQIGTINDGIYGPQIDFAATIEVDGKVTARIPLPSLVPSPVPLPSTAPLFGGGLLAVGVAAYARRRSSVIAPSPQAG